MLRIRYWRLKKALTLMELQDRTGIPFQTLSQYERGDYEPSVERLMLIAKALNISVGQLFPKQPKTEAVAPVAASEA